MPILAAPLADGQLPAAKGTLFTATAITIIKSIILVNGGAGANAVNLYFKKNGGTSRMIATKDNSLAAAASFSWGAGGELVVLDIGGEIEGDAANAAEVDYVISGVQRV